MSRFFVTCVPRRVVTGVTACRHGYATVCRSMCVSVRRRVCVMVSSRARPRVSSHACHGVSCAQRLICANLLSGFRVQGSGFRVQGLELLRAAQVDRCVAQDLVSGYDLGKEEADDRRALPYDHLPQKGERRSEGREQGAADDQRTLSLARECVCVVWSAGRAPARACGGCV